MNSLEPFGSHFINHLFSCAESCPIRMKTLRFLGRADKPVDRRSPEAAGSAAQSGERGSTSEQEQPTHRPPTPALTLHTTPPNKKQRRREAARPTEHLWAPHTDCASDSGRGPPHHSPASPDHCPENQGEFLDGPSLLWESTPGSTLNQYDSPQRFGNLMETPEVCELMGVSCQRRVSNASPRVCDSAVLGAAGSHSTPGIRGSLQYVPNKHSLSLFLFCFNYSTLDSTACNQKNLNEYITWVLILLEISM